MTIPSQAQGREEEGGEERRERGERERGGRGRGTGREESVDKNVRIWDLDFGDRAC
jgi:hypothetical protein